MTSGVGTVAGNDVRTTDTTNNEHRKHIKQYCSTFRMQRRAGQLPSIWQETSVGQMRDDGMPDETRGTRFLPCGDRYGLGKIDKNVPCLCYKSLRAGDETDKIRDFTNSFH